jgi:prepilin-type N-terminal cleavage/methylation domain-containing protein
VKNQGFTFIEVLISMLIFTMTVLAAVDIARGSVRATNDSKTVTQATWLVQSKMVQLETQLEAQGIEKACEEKAEGKFEAPFENFQWRTACYPIDFRLSEAAAQLANSTQDSDSSNATQENPMLKMVMNLASDYISQSMRELNVQVLWMEGKTPREVSLTTHFARYDLLPNIPGVGGGAANPAPGPSPGPGADPTGGTTQ